MTPLELLSAAEIDARLLPHEGAFSQVLHYFKAKTAATRDRWLLRLQAAARGSDWHPVLLARELTPESKDELFLEPRSGAALDALLELARKQLAMLDDAAQPAAPRSAPNYVKAVVAWREANPAGARFSSLVDGLRAAPVEPLSPTPVVEIPEDEGQDDGLPVLEDEPWLGLFRARHGHEVLARIGFGNFNACPDTAAHVARAMRWERDLAASLVYVGPDRYGFAVEKQPRSEPEVRRLMQEQGQLNADEFPSAGALKRLTHWYFWWD